MFRSIVFVKEESGSSEDGYLCPWSHQSFFILSILLFQRVESWFSKQKIRLSIKRKIYQHYFSESLSNNFRKISFSLSLSFCYLVLCISVFVLFSLCISPVVSISVLFGSGRVHVDILLTYIKIWSSIMPSPPQSEKLTFNFHQMGVYDFIFTHKQTIVLLLQSL